jgi:type II secretory pathway pseudopilin PulG
MNRAMSHRGQAAYPIKLIRRLLGPRLAGAAGFTLVEAAIALSILSLGVVMVGQGIFQSLSVQRFWQKDVVATKDLRHATSYFAGDALNAQRTDLVDGAPGAPVAPCLDGVPCAELGWTDAAGNPHLAIYSLNANQLTRNFDGATNIIAPRVAEVSFTRTGSVVSFSMRVQAERGGFDDINLTAYLRKLS